MFERLIVSNGFMTYGEMALYFREVLKKLYWDSQREVCPTKY